MVVKQNKTVSNSARVSKSAIVGYYGVGNYGDDLFCAVLSRLYKRVLPLVQATFVSSPIRDVDAHYIVRGRLRERLFRSSGVPGALTRTAYGLEALRRSDTVVLGGGSVLSSVSGVRGVQKRLMRLRPRRLVGAGVSIGPFARPADAVPVNEFLRGFSVVSVRDRRSYDHAEALGLPGLVTLSGDLAALYVPPSSPVDLSGRGDFGLAPCPFPGFNLERHMHYLGVLAEELHGRLSDAEPRVTVFALNGHPRSGDEGLAHVTAQHLVGLGVHARVLTYRRLGIARTWDEIGELSGLLSTRLHGAITAYLQNVPFALFEYHAKCHDFCDDIGQANVRRLPPNSCDRRLRVAIRSLSTPDSPHLSIASYRARCESAWGSGTSDPGSLATLGR